MMEVYASGREMRRVRVDILIGIGELKPCLESEKVSQTRLDRTSPLRM